MRDDKVSDAVDRVLVLWDIDMTLVMAGPASREAYAQALLSVTGRPLTERVDFGGRTDLHIARETLRAHGLLPTEDLVRRLNEAFAEAFHARARQVHADGVALPGATAALEALAGLPHVVQGVLTGNQRATAPLKLSLLGSAVRHLSTDAGAYGDDHEDRNHLVPVARDRAAALTGTSYPGRRTVLIGDTVRDIEAALANNAAAIGVATGRTTPTELTEAGAHAVLPDLTDTPRLIDAVLSTTRTESAA